MNKCFSIETNQDFEFNYSMTNLKKIDNVMSFDVENLAKLEIFEKDLKIVLDEIKVAENSTKSNNNLIISEIEGKVYLPYTKEELNQKIKECFTYHSSLKTNVKLDINMYPNRLED